MGGTSRAKKLVAGFERETAEARSLYADALGERAPEADELP